MNWRMAMVAATALATGACGEIRENVSAGIVQTVTGTMLGPKPANTADFVTAARPERTGFMAVGVTPPAREIKPKTKAEVAATEAELANAAAQQQAAGAAVEAERQRVLQSAPKPPKVE